MFEVHCRGLVLIHSHFKNRSNFLWVGNGIIGIFPDFFGSCIVIPLMTMMDRQLAAENPGNVQITESDLGFSFFRPETIGNHPSFLEVTTQQPETLVLPAFSGEQIPKQRPYQSHTKAIPN